MVQMDEPGAPSWSKSPTTERRAGTTAERKRELRTEAIKKTRQSPLFFDLTLSLSKSTSIFHASLAQKAVALAQQDKSTWTRADLIKYLGRVLPRSGQDPAAAPSGYGPATWS